MALLSVSCPKCGQPYDLPENLAGRLGRCASCQNHFQVPATDDFIPTVPQASRPRAAPVRKSSNIVLIGNIIFLGVVPLLTIGIVAFLVTRARKPAETVDVATSKPAATKIVVHRGPTREELLCDLESPDELVRVKAVRGLGESPQPNEIQPLTNRAITDPAPKVRVEALRALAQAGPPQRGLLYEPLLQLQTHRDPEVRRAAAETLTGFGRPPAEQLSALRAGLKAPEEPVRTLAVRLLEQMGPDAAKAIPDLAAAARDISSDVRISAVKIIARIGGTSPEAKAALIAAAGDPDAQVRREAVVGLRLLGKQAGVLPALFVAAERSPNDPQLQQELAAALPAFDGVAPEEANLLVKGLKSPNSGVRSWAADQLGKLGPAGTDALPELAAALQRTSQSVQRLELLLAIGRILAAGHYDQGATPEQIAKLTPVAEVLVALLDDPDPNVRESVLKVIGPLGPAVEKAVPALVKRLPDPAAVTALGKIGPPAAAAVPDLIKVLDGQKSLRIINARSNTVDPNTGRYFTYKKIDHPNPSLDPLLKATIKALGRIGAVAVPELTKALHSTNVAVRWAACEALAAIGPPAKEAVPALQARVAATDVEVIQVRHAARDAIAAIRGGGK